MGYIGYRYSRTGRIELVMWRFEPKKIRGQTSDLEQNRKGRQSTLGNGESVSLPILWHLKQCFYFVKGKSV